MGDVTVKSREIGKQAPLHSDLVHKQVAVNEETGAIYTKNAQGGVIQIGKAISVNSISEMESLPDPTIAKECNVYDSMRGGTFVYKLYTDIDPRTGSTYTEDNGTVFTSVGNVGFWVRQYYGVIDVKWFGAKGDETTDDTIAIQAAIDYASLRSEKLLITDGIYGTTNEINTKENLYMEFASGAWIKPYDFSTVGAVLTNVISGDVPGSIQDNIVIINPQLDLGNLPYSTATSNDNAIGFSRQATNVKIIGGYIKNVLAVWSTGMGGTGGKGVNFEHGAYNCAIEGTITFENCYTGLYINGLMGDESGYNKGASTISIGNIIAINCDSAVTVGSIDSTQVTDKDPFWNSYTINSIVFRNCGYSVSRDLSSYTTKLYQKSGAINISGARNLTINSITGWNESTYAPYSTITDTNNIGYGLTNNIGAVVWGHGHNIHIKHIAYNGKSDSLLHVGMCYSVGDSNPPSNLVGSIDNFYIEKAYIYANMTNIFEGDPYYPITDGGAYNITANIILGSDVSAPLTYTDTILDNQLNNTRVSVTNSLNATAEGSLSQLANNLGSPFAHSVNVSYITQYMNMPYINNEILVESGINTNGHWYKFESGLMMCTNSIIVSSDIDTVAGSIFTNDLQSWTFPLTFISPPEVSATQSTSVNIWVSTTSSTTSSYIRAFSWMSNVATTGGVYRLSAIGRWK